MKGTLRHALNIHFVIRLLIMGALIVGMKFASKLNDFTRIAPFIYLMPILTGTLLVAYSIFPAGERGTSPIYQDTKRKKRQPVGFIDVVLFKGGIQFLLIGYFIQLIFEAVKIYR